MFSVQGLIYDNNASHDLSSFTVDCANGCNDKCMVERQLRSAIQVPPDFTRHRLPDEYCDRESRTSGEAKKLNARQNMYNYLKEYLKKNASSELIE